MTGELINHVWQSTWFAMLAALLTMAFHKNRAEVRFWLWFSASLKFLIPFSLLLSLGSHLEWAPGARRIALQAVSVTAGKLAQPFPYAMTSEPSTPGDADWMPVVILGVWACGFLGVAVTRLRDWRRIRAAMSSTTPLDIFAFETTASVEVRISPSLLEPGVVGLWRPVLLLPAGITERLTPPQLEAVLAHELCHVRRRDNLLSSIHMVTEAICWFHPLVWWIGTWIIEERERACDEEVLRLGSEPRIYAEGILNVCKLYVESSLACVSGVTAKNLKRRLEAIMNNRIGLGLNRAKKALLASAGIAAVVVPLLIGVGNAPMVRAQLPTTTPSQSTVAHFDVVAIRENRSPLFKAGMSLRDGSLQVNNLLLKSLITSAYGVREVLIFGLPGWAEKARYDIRAKVTDADPKVLDGISREQRRALMAAMLEDRFHLKLHAVTKNLPVYDLTVARGGPRFNESVGHGVEPHVETGRTEYSATGTSILGLSYFLEEVVERTVIDKTNLTGAYDLHLKWAPDQTGDPDSDSFPSIFTALQEQLGLKLQPDKGAVKTLFVDHLERPSEN